MTELNEYLALDAAIREYVATKRPGAVVAEWALVAGIMSLDADAPQTVHLQHSKDTPFWRIGGLLQVGQGMYTESDDE